MQTSKKHQKNARPATPAEVYASESRSIEKRLKDPIVLEARFDPTRGGLTGFGSIKRELTDEEAEQQYFEKGMEKLRLALAYFKIDPTAPMHGFF